MILRSRSPCFGICTVRDGGKEVGVRQCAKCHYEKADPSSYVHEDPGPAMMMAERLRSYIREKTVKQSRRSVALAAQAALAARASGATRTARRAP